MRKQLGRIRCAFLTHWSSSVCSCPQQMAAGGTGAVSPVDPPLCFSVPADGGRWERYSVQAFCRPLLELVSREQERPDTPSHCVTERAPIVVSNYAGMLSLLHNATGLGFFKNRGRVSF